jgi:hypothetical protein
MPSRRKAMGENVGSREASRLSGGGAWSSDRGIATLSYRTESIRLEGFAGPDEDVILAVQLKALGGFPKLIYPT